MSKEHQKYLTRREVLARFSISNTTLYRWLQDDALNFPKSISVGPRCVRWELAELEQWEAERKNAA